MLSIKIEKRHARISEQDIAENHTEFIIQPDLTPEQVASFIIDATENMTSLRDTTARQTLETAIELGRHYYCALSKQYKAIH